MRPIDYLRLFTLAAIWGGSFIFMRVLAPSLGAFATADLRVLIGGLVLCVYARFVRLRPHWREQWRHYVMIGMAYSGIPFVLYSFAALHLPAGYSAIINALAPIFGALFSAVWLNERLTPSKIVGFALGFCGVALVAWHGGAPRDRLVPWAVLACVGATVCYGLAGVYTKKFATHLKPIGIATFSQLTAGLILLPVAAIRAPTGPFTMTILLNLLGLAVVCSSIAFILFYRLIADVGPTRAMTVTFLLPGFSMLWGLLFLGEPVSLIMMAGFALVVTGTMAVGGTLSALLRPVRATG